MIAPAPRPPSSDAVAGRRRDRAPGARRAGAAPRRRSPAARTRRCARARVRRRRASGARSGCPRASRRAALGRQRSPRRLGAASAPTTNSTPTNEAAFSTKVAPGPPPPTTKPPSAGPTARATFIEMPFERHRRRAAPSRGTSSGMIAASAARACAAPTPIAKVRPSSAAGVERAGEREQRRAPSARRAQRVTSSRRRRSTTSASAPAGSASRKNGRLDAVCTSATISGDGASDRHQPRRRRSASTCRGSRRGRDPERAERRPAQRRPDVLLGHASRARVRTAGAGWGRARPEATPRRD